MNSNINESVFYALSGLDVSSDGMADFLTGLSNSWMQYNKKNELNKKEAIKDFNNKVLMQAIKKLHGDGSGYDELKKPSFEIDNINDFILEYSRLRLKSFREMFNSIKDELPDGMKYIIMPDELSNSKARKKFENAVKAFAHEPSGRSYDLERYIPNYKVDEFDLVVLFDTTIWGSGKTGICFTDTFVVYKSIGTIPHDLFYYSNIDSINVDEDKRCLIISGLSSAGDTEKRFSYICHYINSKLSKVVGSVNDYVSQPAFKVIKHLIK